MDDSAGEDGEFREDLLSHMEDVNDLASGWRNDVTLVADYVVDIEADAFEDDAGRDDAMEGLKETLEALGETSREMKAKLREIRDFLEA
jgi:uncharacterized protein with HEPN domain